MSNLEIDKKLQNAISKLLEHEKQLLVDIVEWVTSTSSSTASVFMPYRMKTIHGLANHDVNVGGIWCVDDVESVLSDMSDHHDMDVSMIDRDDMRRALSKWNDFISGDEMRLWNDFVWAWAEDQIDYQKGERQ